MTTVAAVAAAVAVAAVAAAGGEGAEVVPFERSRINNDQSYTLLPK